MRIDQTKCIGCKKCIPVCCGGAIFASDNTCRIDEDLCVECYVCLMSEICPTGAIEKVPLKWPRTLRHVFSAMCTVHQDTGINGRGTSEMKDNDVTGRYKLGMVGFSVDVGRPGVGTTFAEVEKIALAVAQEGVMFEESNPTTELMSDRRTGRFREDIKAERVLSCILEFTTKEDNLVSVVNTLREVAKDINTVFTVGCISRCRPDGTIPAKDVLDRARIDYQPNGKINIGLGRPLAP